MEIKIISAEINRNQKESEELNKILTSLKSLLNSVLEEKQSIGTSINKFRANIKVPEVQPSFF